MLEELICLFRRQALYKLDQLVNCAHGGTPFWMGELQFAKLLYYSKILSVYTVWDIHTFQKISSCKTDTFRVLAIPSSEGIVHRKFTITIRDAAG